VDQPLARLAWKQLRREATGWQALPEALPDLLQPKPQPRPGDPWSNPWSDDFPPACWLPGSAIVRAAKVRAIVTEEHSVRLDFGDDQLAGASAVLPADIPWLPGDQVGTGLHPITWSWIQERLAIRALATAQTRDLPLPLRQLAAALAGEIMLCSAGSRAYELNGDALLMYRAKASAMLGAAIEIGAFSSISDQRWTLAPETAVWHQIDAGLIVASWALSSGSDYYRTSLAEMPRPPAWPGRLVVRLSRRDMDHRTVRDDRWWPLSPNRISHLDITDFQLVAPRLADACLTAGLPMDAQAKPIIERQAAWWRDNRP
jgi:hypothetical protein